VIPGERTDQPARELAAQRRLEAVAGPRPGVTEPGDAAAVIQQAGDGFPVVMRRGGHGPPGIGRATAPSDP
jgi:hypothetical protein